MNDNNKNNEENNNFNEPMYYPSGKPIPYGALKYYREEQAKKAEQSNIKPSEKDNSQGINEKQPDNNFPKLETVRMAVGKVKANIEKLRDNKKYRLKVIAAATALTVTLTATGLNSYIAGRNSVKTLPNGYKQEVITVLIKDGEDLGTIASKYYNENYTGYYKDLYDYVDRIAEINKILDPDRIEANDTLKIPVIFNTANPSYVSKLYYQNELDNFELSYDTKYLIESNDQLDDILYRLTGCDANGLAEIKKEVMRRSNLSDENKLRNNKVLKLPNPADCKKKAALEEQLEKATDDWLKSLLNSYTMETDINGYTK